MSHRKWKCWVQRHQIYQHRFFHGKWCLWPVVINSIYREACNLHYIGYLSRPLWYHQETATLHFPNTSMFIYFKVSSKVPCQGMGCPFSNTGQEESWVIQSQRKTTVFLRTIKGEPATEVTILLFHEWECEWEARNLFMGGLFIERKCNQLGTPSDALSFLSWFLRDVASTQFDIRLLGSLIWGDIFFCLGFFSIGNAYWLSQWGFSSKFLPDISDPWFGGVTFCLLSHLAYFSCLYWTFYASI